MKHHENGLVIANKIMIRWALLIHLDMISHPRYEIADYNQSIKMY